MRKRKEEDRKRRRRKGNRGCEWVRGSLRSGNIFCYALGRSRIANLAPLSIIVHNGPALSGFKENFPLTRLNFIAIKNVLIFGQRLR